MTPEQRLQNLSVPSGIADVVMDTDAANEIDDQFAIAYLLRSPEKLRPLRFYAAPFLGKAGDDPGEGMEKSFAEIRRIQDLAEENVPTLRGSRAFLKKEDSSVPSEAAEDLAALAESYSPEHPLYILAIAALTNIASAVTLNPAVAENCVLVWLGGHAEHFGGGPEFNLIQDVAAARTVLRSGIPFVHLPCEGVVSQFSVSGPELRYWLSGRNPLCDDLAEHTIRAAESYAAGTPWTRCIWDVTTVGWMLNDSGKFMYDRIAPTLFPLYDGKYETRPDALPCRYVYYIARDALAADLFRKLSGGKRKE